MSKLFTQRNVHVVRIEPQWGRVPDWFQYRNVCIANIVYSTLVTHDGLGTFESIGVLNNKIDDIS